MSSSDENNELEQNDGYDAGADDEQYDGEAEEYYNNGEGMDDDYSDEDDYYDEDYDVEAGSDKPQTAASSIWGGGGPRHAKFRHASTGWDVRLPIMEEYKYCGCLSWLLFCVLLPFFGGCICCCPVDKRMRPKKYINKTCCESFWDFMQPSRRRAEMEALDERRDFKWSKTEAVEQREAEMDNDQKMADDRGDATDLVLAVLTKHSKLPQSASTCCPERGHRLRGEHGFYESDNSNKYEEDEASNSESYASSQPSSGSSDDSDGHDSDSEIGEDQLFDESLGSYDRARFNG